MKMKIIFITLLLFFSITPVSAEVITVGVKNADYTSIQGAIDNANDTDIIIVYSGVYSENLLINKTWVAVRDINLTS